MGASQMRRAALVIYGVIYLASVCCWAQTGQAGEAQLSQEQIEQFLLTAKVIKSKQANKGITGTVRLTLSDGHITHEASFQAVDEHKGMEQFPDGRMEMNFVDSYKYNIAAYKLAELLGIQDILPVYVARKWEGTTGSMSWWLPIQMDEQERLKRKVDPPDPDAWNKQMYRIRVFDQLIYDSDPNLTNVLIGTDWKVYRIDFTRAFRRFKTLQHPDDLVRCDRQLLAKLKALDRDQLASQTKGFLTKDEVNAVMARRDKLVAHFETLTAKQGEAQVLY